MATPLPWLSLRSTPRGPAQLTAERPPHDSATQPDAPRALPPAPAAEGEDDQGPSGPPVNIRSAPTFPHPVTARMGAPYFEYDAWIRHGARLALDFLRRTVNDEHAWSSISRSSGVVAVGGRVDTYAASAMIAFCMENDRLRSAPGPKLSLVNSPWMPEMRSSR